jgi:hypothetical protein
MKHKTFLLIALCLIVLLVAGFTLQKTQWEYKFEYNLSEKKANALGAEGWELVTASSTGSGPTSNVETFVFKRPK